jgi:hypothetical protein
MAALPHLLAKGVWSYNTVGPYGHTTEHSQRSGSCSLPLSTGQLPLKSGDLPISLRSGGYLRAKRSLMLVYIPEKQ